jgi:DNA-binding MarR family transcriptional regulator
MGPVEFSPLAKLKIGVYTNIMNPNILPLLPTDLAQTISGQCPFFQMKKTLRQLQGFYDGFFAPTAMTPTQFALMLGMYDIDPVPMGVLSQWYGMDRTTMTRNLKLLEKEGWAFFEPGQDKRQKCWTLTHAGMDKVREGLPLWYDARKMFLALYSEGETTELIRRLTMLREALPEPT